MKVSNIGIISKKIEKVNEQFPVQDMLLQTGQLIQYGSGVYGYGHIPFLVKRKIGQVISDTLKKYGCAEVSLPLLQPEQMWLDSGRFQKYMDEKVLFRVLTKDANYCLAPTAEEAVVLFAKDKLKSYKQLPVTYFQIGEKFRNELRSRGFLLRGKSFEMMDAYSFGRDFKDLEVEYENIKKAYAEIFNILGLNVQPVGADSGAIGGSKSEEFMCLSEIGEDNILFDAKSGRAFNSELLDREDASEYLLNTYGIENLSDLSSKKAVELGHVFQIGDKYSESMGIKYIDADGVEKNYQMGCYGIGVSRTLAMVYENSARKGDKAFNGIVLPKNLSPYLIYLVPKTDDKALYAEAERIYQELLAQGVSVLFDDRDGLSIGAKAKDSTVVGTPYVAILGNSLKNGVIELEDNATGQKESVQVQEFVSYVSNLNKD